MPDFEYKTREPVIKSLPEPIIEFAIELSFNNRTDIITLPINPESIEVKEGGKGKTYDILGNGRGSGEINIIQNVALTEISFSSSFPVDFYPAVVVNELYMPEYYLSYIKKWMQSNRPIRFHAVSKSFILDFPVSIERFDWKEVGGSSGEIEYSLSLKQYAFYSAVKAEVVTTISGDKVLAKKPAERPDERVRPDKYTLKAGDTLIKVAMKFFNTNSSRWKDIQKLNGISDAELRSLQVGRVIKLPKN